MFLETPNIYTTTTTTTGFVWHGSTWPCWIHKTIICIILLLNNKTVKTKIIIAVFSWFFFFKWIPIESLSSSKCKFYNLIVHHKNRQKMSNMEGRTLVLSIKMTKSNTKVIDAALVTILQEYCLVVSYNTQLVLNRNRQKRYIYHA